MKYKVSELGGALLDAAVAKSFGDEGELFNISHCGEPSWLFNGAAYSSDWAAGGPIMGKEEIELVREEVLPSAFEWKASHMHAENPQYGYTMLLAAMRVFVASKFGDEVEFP